MNVGLLIPINNYLIHESISICWVSQNMSKINCDKKIDTEEFQIVGLPWRENQFSAEYFSLLDYFLIGKIDLES